MSSANGRKVNVIPAKMDLPYMAIGQDYQKKRVAAYARVSTDEEEQLSSYETQINVFTRQIKKNPAWEFVEVYADEAVSGTNINKREGFKRMVADALAGKIDLILTKSISRFARNTVDTLTTVRKLKESGVEVYFEKENIYTLDSKGELLITIMSSLAQDESRSISENVTWGKRKSMEDGKVSLPYKRFLGYEKGEDGLPRIVEAEAKIVRQIYALFLEGQTYRNIAQLLTEQGIQTPSGKTNWSVSTVMSILSNEKYKGDALLQKTFTVDFLNKTMKKNEGELTQIYIENSHPAIINPETFNLVQSEIKKRQPNRRQLNNNSPFAAKIICGECGGYYGSKVWHSTSKYQYKGWRCNRKYADDVRCNTPRIREEELKVAFIQAFNQILGDKNRYIDQFEELLPLLADSSALETKLEEAQTACDAAVGRMRRYVEENTRQIQNQEEYKRHFCELDDECKATGKFVADIKGEILERGIRREKIRRYLDELRQVGDIVTEFDEGLWQTMVESVTINTDKSLIFIFMDGTEIPVKPPEHK
ncbi:MAG: recombinase family protein [Firmicutes bacterium]|nr:recombinase family protein [Bacillota bacterium]